MAAEAPERPGIWSWARELNSGQALSSIGGTPIAILGGFSLANAITAAKDNDGIFRDIAVACFGAAVSFFIVALMFIIIAARYTSSPNERLEWAPEAKRDPEKVEALRKFQRQDEWLLDQYSRNIGWATTVGIVGALTGAAFLLLSTHRTWAVIMISVLLFMVAITAILANLQWPSWLFPSPDNWDGKDPSPLTEEEWDLIRDGGWIAGGNTK